MVTRSRWRHPHCHGTHRCHDYAGELTGDAFNGWTFTPNPNWNGTVELTYDVTDGTDSTSATASFNATLLNPTLFDLGSVEEDLGYKGDEEDIIEQGTAALGLNPFVITEEQLLANFTDADDAIADLSVVNLIADSGTLTQTPDGWEFIPSEDFVGNVNFSFSVTDGEASTPATAKLAVTNVNDDLYDDWGWVDTDITGGPEDEAIAISSEQLLDSIDYDENWDEEDLSISGSPSPLLVLVRLLRTERVATRSTLPMTSTAAFPSPTRLLIQKAVPLMSSAPSVCSPLTMRPRLQKEPLIPSLGWMRTAPSDFKR